MLFVPGIDIYKLINVVLCYSIVDYIRENSKDKNMCRVFMYMVNKCCVGLYYTMFGLPKKRANIKSYNP